MERNYVVYAARDFFKTSIKSVISNMAYSAYNTLHGAEPIMRSCLPLSY
jgi:hypothetical protein